MKLLREILEDLSRRDFLKGAGAAAATGLVGKAGADTRNPTHLEQVRIIRRIYQDSYRKYIAFGKKHQTAHRTAYKEADQYRQSKRFQISMDDTGIHRSFGDMAM